MLGVVDHGNFMPSLPPHIEVGPCWKKSGEVSIEHGRAACG